MTSEQIQRNIHVLEEKRMLIRDVQERSVREKNSVIANLRHSIETLHKNTNCFQEETAASSINI